MINDLTKIEADIFRNTPALRVVQGPDYVAPEYDMPAHQAESLVRERLRKISKSSHRTSTFMTSRGHTAVVISSPQ